MKKRDLLRDIEFQHAYIASLCVLAKKYINQIFNKDAVTLYESARKGIILRSSVYEEASQLEVIIEQIEKTL